MATVTGLTSERMAELVAEWEQLRADQEAMSAKMNDLQAELASARGQLSNFEQNTVPDLQAQVGGQTAAVSDLSGLQAGLDQAQQHNNQLISDITGVDIPSLQDSIYSQHERLNEMPTTIVSDTMPLDDDPDRPLVPGDKWFDPADGQKEYRWTGTEWVPSALDVADLSLTVRKFKVSTHLIY